MSKPIVDLHCHPAMKPLGKSFKKKYVNGENNFNTDEENSIWWQRRPKLFKRVTNVLFSLTKWRQSDCSTLLDGNNRVIVASLYPFEKGMVVHRDAKDAKLSGRLIRNLAAGIGLRRIRHFQKMPDYFTDLETEYRFYEQLHDEKVLIKGIQKNYKLIKKSSDLILSDQNCINIILSIEGAHVFNCGLQREGRQTVKQEVLDNLDKVKRWSFRPMFITLAHHFDNELCGFAKSLTGIVATQIKQFPNPDQGITTLGADVLRGLLDNKDGRRILIDIKHMNPKSRYEYYDFLKNEYSTENIPIIVSHGALNGKLHYRTHNYVMKRGFNVADINFFFDEIQLIEKSKGIFGIQLDERRIFNSKLKDDIYKRAQKKMNNYGKKRLRKNSYFIWRQIETIALYLDMLGREAWNIQALGTDFDGVINPLNGWWTAKELKVLDQYLIYHAEDFLKSKNGQKLKTFNKLTANKIVDKFLSDNALDFIKRNF
jgi:microsomal dipeptidase-like Zn-dependent dipeptidase